MRQDWQRCGICGSDQLWRDGEVPHWCEDCGAYYHFPSAQWCAPRTSKHTTAELPAQADHAALQEAKVKEVLVFLRDPNTYVVRPGHPLGVWMDDGLKIARLLEERFLSDPAEFSMKDRVEHVRRAAIAVGLTAFILSSGEDGARSIHWWNASDETVLFEWTQDADDILRMPDGQRVAERYTFFVGFGPQTDA